MTAVVYIGIFVFLYVFGNFLMKKIDSFLDDGCYKSDPPEIEKHVKQ